MLLCTHHHRLVHEGGWSIGRDDGEWTFIAPDGQAMAAEPTHEVAGDSLTWLQEWAVGRGLDLGPDANLPLWDGTRPDYDLSVAGLLAGG
jgi:hypothetical protein